MKTHLVHGRSLAIVAAIVASAGLTVSAAAPATAAPPASAWVRVGHFSPNTKAVDVQISALAGGSAIYSLDDVTYGQVSKYLPMTAGEYVIAMRPATASAASVPIISRTVDVAAGSATTIAAYGPNAKLKTAVFRDDLAAPASGDARIRVIQVSTRHPKLVVRTSAGQLISKNAKPGTATGYTTVPAGTWTLNATGSGTHVDKAVTLTNGTVDSVLVLDNASGGVTLMTLVDSATTGVQPIGGVQTGGGWLALHHLQTSIEPVHAPTHRFVQSDR
jgi:Domain of unknown function (DUF4397)